MWSPTREVSRVQIYAHGLPLMLQEKGVNMSLFHWGAGCVRAKSPPPPHTITCSPIRQIWSIQGLQGAVRPRESLSDH